MPRHSPIPAIDDTGLPHRPAPRPRFPFGLSPRFYTIGMFLLIGLSTTAVPLWASPPTAPPEAKAVRVPEPPALDGDVLQDPVWHDAPVASGFWQTQPNEGQPASERTEVRIVYTDKTLYFGIVCYDREPGGIVVTESRRDASLDDTDSFQIILDTYLDRQNGFVFGTNPAGIEYDGQVAREGEGGQGGLFGGTSGFYLNWDASWDVKTLTGSFGWSAEFAIPFRTIRYPRGGAQVWGLNFQRNIRRHNETAFWAPLSHQFNLYRLSSAGTLRGIETRKQRNLKVTPYVLGEVQRDYEAGNAWEDDVEAGLDIKYSLTPSLTLDVTVNTDFAQVEVDEQQVNIDRSNLFFPEKRPFFLENAGFFTMGTPREVELFFSRRIGIGPGGEIVPILAGARVSGKFLETNVGLLNIQTQSVGDAIPDNNFTVARVGRELPNRSGIAAMFVNRTATGDSADSDDYNRTWGLDGRWGIGQYGQLLGYVAGTSTPGIEDDDKAFHITADYSSPKWRLSAKYTDVGEGFNPEVGFLSRTAYRSPDVFAMRIIRPADTWGLLEIQPHFRYYGFWAPDGFHESSVLHIENNLLWKSGHILRTGVNFTHEGLQEPFEIFPGVVVLPGKYDHTEGQIIAETNQAAPLSFGAELYFGGFYGGDRVSFSPSIKARLGETFQAELGWERNDVDLPVGKFVTNLVKSRISYSFTPRLYVQALFQYNDTIDNWSTNLRFGWLQTANTGRFIVYNENRDTELGGSKTRDRRVTVKYSRQFDLLN